MAHSLLLSQSWQARLRTLALIFVGLSAAALSGCAPKIGDHCVLNTDCGTSGTLVCDTSLPGGYCTQFNCTPDVCQNSAACVAFEPAVPGCPYDDYRSPSRTARTFCMAQCHSDSDCRQSDGYICADPRSPPWNAAIIDDAQWQRVYIPGYSPSASRFPPEGGLLEGSVCSASGPQVPGVDASIDAAGEDGPAVSEAGDVRVDAASDAGVDVLAEASAEGAVDGAPDATTGDDGAADASSEGATDAGAADAPDGG